MDVSSNDTSIYINRLVLMLMRALTKCNLLEKQPPRKLVEHQVFDNPRTGDWLPAGRGARSNSVQLLVCTCINPVQLT